MFLKKATFILVIGLLLTSTVGTGSRFLPQPAHAEIAKISDKEEPVKKPSLVGTWRAKEVHIDGIHCEVHANKNQTWVFTKDQIEIRYSDGSSDTYTYETTTEKEQVLIDLGIRDTLQKGIARLDKDRLTLCINRNTNNGKRPKSVDDIPDRTGWCVVLDRQREDFADEDPRKELRAENKKLRRENEELRQEMEALRDDLKRQEKRLADCRAEIWERRDAKEGDKHVNELAKQALGRLACVENEVAKLRKQIQNLIDETK